MHNCLYGMKPAPGLAESIQWRRDSMILVFNCRMSPLSDRFINLSIAVDVMV